MADYSTSEPTSTEGNIDSESPAEYLVDASTNTEGNIDSESPAEYLIEVSTIGSGSVRDIHRTSISSSIICHESESLNIVFSGVCTQQTISSVSPGKGTVTEISVDTEVLSTGSIVLSSKASYLIDVSVSSESRILTNRSQDFLASGTVVGSSLISSSCLATYQALNPISSEGLISSISSYGYSTSNSISGSGKIDTLANGSYKCTLRASGSGTISSTKLVNYISALEIISSVSISSAFLQDLEIKTSISSLGSVSKATWSYTVAANTYEYTDLALALYNDSLQPCLFSNFKFNSFITHDDKTYAACEEGICLLGESETDLANEVITPAIKMDLGNLNSYYDKQLRSVYADDGSTCIVDLDNDLEYYTFSAKQRASCKRTHHGNHIKVSIVDFSALNIAEVFYYDLARKF